MRVRVKVRGRVRITLTASTVHAATNRRPLPCPHQLRTARGYHTPTLPSSPHVARGYHHIRAFPLYTGKEWNRVGEEYAHARRIYNERYINNPRRATAARSGSLPLPLPLPTPAPAATLPSSTLLALVCEAASCTEPPGRGTSMAPAATMPLVPQWHRHDDAWQRDEATGASGHTT